MGGLKAVREEWLRSASVVSSTLPPMGGLKAIDCYGAVCVHEVSSTLPPMGGLKEITDPALLKVFESFHQPSRLWVG